MKRLLRFSLSLCIALGLGLAAWPLAQTAYARWNQSRLQSQWKQETGGDRTEVVKRHATTENILPKPQSKIQNPKSKIAWPPTRIVIPDIGLDAVVVQGVDVAALRLGPGHEPFSALPGQLGNCVIAGHRNVYGSYFLRLDALQAGSQIILKTPAQSFSYRVSDIYTVEDNNTVIFKPLDPNVPQVTLITCTLPLSSERLAIVAQLN